MPPDTFIDLPERGEENGRCSHRLKERKSCYHPPDVRISASGVNVSFPPIADIRTISQSLGMFEVVAVRRQFLTKRISFRALEPMAGTETLVGGGLHGLTALKAPYSFASGFIFELKYPFWSPLNVGDKVELRDVLDHPEVQRELVWKARQSAQR
jgi:hypothetical protein